MYLSHWVYHVKPNKVEAAERDKWYWYLLVNVIKTIHKTLISVVHLSH